MQKTLPFLLWLATSFVFVDSRQLEEMPGFERDIVVKGKEIIQALPYGVTDNQNFVYSVCDITDYSFSRKRCNVTIERPIFSDAIFASTCPITIEPDTKHENAMLSQLLIFTFGEDQLVMSWLQEDVYSATKRGKLKILKMSTCEFMDVPIPADEIKYIVIYKDLLDVGLTDQKYCHSAACKVTVNSRGTVLTGPTIVSSGVEFDQHYGIVPVSKTSPEKGFYMSAILEGEYNLKHTEHFYLVDVMGRTTEFGSASVDFEQYAGFSYNHEYLALCESNRRADFSVVTCRQYDRSLNLHINVTMEFQDKEFKRWMQPHNLEDGSMLMLTGRSRDSEGTHYDRLKVFPFDSQNRKGRPLRVRRLNMECKHLRSLRVRVIETEDNQICFHFICDRGNENQSALKFNSKCLSKSYFLTAI